MPAEPVSVEAVQLIQLAARVISEGLSVRQLERAIEKLSGGEGEGSAAEEAPAPAPLRPATTRALEAASSVWGKRLRLHAHGEEREIRLRLSDEAQLEQLLKLLQSLS